MMRARDAASSVAALQAVIVMMLRGAANAARRLPIALAALPLLALR